MERFMLIDDLDDKHQGSPEDRNHGLVDLL